MRINIDDVYSSTWENYQRAKKSVSIIEKTLLEHRDLSAISDVIPGFEGV